MAAVHFDFHDATVIVAGANGGIGLAVTELFLQAGASVIALVHHRREQIDALSGANASLASKISVLEIELTDEQQVATVLGPILDQHQRVDYLVNCVGGYVDGDEWNISPAAWRKTLDNNLLSALLLSKVVAAKFVAQQSGAMVHVASRYAQSARPDSIAYSASKAGLVSLVQSYAQVLTPFGRANAVSPGAIYTGYWLTASKEEKEFQLQKIPMHDFVQLNQVVDAIAFLCTDSARMITGQQIKIDGGYSIR